MKLRKARITKYKSIEDSEEWHVGDVTCLVGKNEAGKSALLEALHKLNPDTPSVANFMPEDYPRRFALSPEGKLDIKTANVLTTSWVLDKSECENLNSEIPGLKLESGAEVILRKGYDNVRKWDVGLSEEKIIEALLQRVGLSSSDLGADSPTTIKSLNALIIEMKEKDEKIQKLEQDLKKFFPELSLEKAIEAKLSAFLPKFLYFKEYYRLPGRVAINDLLERRANQERYEFEFRVFDALLKLVGTTAEEINASGKSEELFMKLEGISNHLSATIFKYWTQNRHLSVRFGFDQARPKDPAPFNQGFIFSTRIVNERHKASVSFDQRSTGFIWFFSFLIWFSEVRETYGDNLIILLDEPGLTLHGTAQKDLLEYMNKELRPNYQVIYSTHSPFMIDVEHIFELRTVQDVVVKKGDVEEVKGTKVSDRILSRDADTLLPLQGIAGFDIAQTMFVGPYVLVVEGPSEHAFINWFSRALTSQGRNGLDLRWAIAPAEGAAKVSSFVSLFSGRGLKIVALMDYHDGQKKMVDELKASKLLPDGHVLKTSEFTEKAESDIEDLLGWELYKVLINSAFDLHPSHQFSEQGDVVKDKRIVKYVEDKFKVMPPSSPEFDHYKAAQFLLGTSVHPLPKMPGLDEALNRFEKLFARINELLK